MTNTNQIVVDNTIGVDLEVTTIDINVKSTFTTMKSEDIFTVIAGGEMVRGAVRKTMLHLLSIGFTTSQVADLLNKRYQHVRNVAQEEMKKNK